MGKSALFFERGTASGRREYENKNILNAFIDKSIGFSQSKLRVLSSIDLLR
jgi:hypothetical protein